MISSSSDATSEPGLRERKKVARREALVSASHRLVREHGLDHVTVEMICDAVGVSPRTFFNYFESKIDAVLGIEPWVLDPEVAATFVAGGPTGRTLDDCAHIVASVLTSSPVDHDRMGDVMELAQREPALVVRQLAWFEQHKVEVEKLVARRNGNDVPGPAEEIVGSMIMVMTRGSFRYWDASGRTGAPSTCLPTVVAELRRLLTDS
ncbi:TetR/AcrR family transcriptional regulator [Sanguibacter sp. 25GB23B1]|uniref:TetR/AcrR family transcriptional regulator n=1 Tax=unclassified Sanguibacter TaxID=2645534 RepID=UPI0032AEE848